MKTKVAVNGDVSQIDVRNSGLMDAIDRCSQIPSVKCIRFTVDDVVRSGIVQESIESCEKPIARRSCAEEDLIRQS